MVIRVSGYPGAGKSTLAKRLAETLGYEDYGASALFRHIAEEKGMSIEDFYKSLATNPEAERETDARTTKLMAEKDSLIVEGRVAPFLPCPYPHVNILLLCDPAIAAIRNLKRPENAGRTPQNMRAQTEERVAVEKKHYQDLYQIPDHFAPAAYDIVIDTTSITPDEVFAQVKAALPTP